MPQLPNKPCALSLALKENSLRGSIRIDLHTHAAAASNSSLKLWLQHGVDGDMSGDTRESAMQAELPQKGMSSLVWHCQEALHQPSHVHVCYHMPPGTGHLHQQKTGPATPTYVDCTWLQLHVLK